MKRSGLVIRKNPGLVLVAIGLAIWLVPFVLVAADNALGTTRPADWLIGKFGLLIITFGPALVLSGLILILYKIFRQLFR